MVRYDGPHTTLIGPRDQQLTAALLLLHISSYIHVFVYIISYLVPGHLSVWEGHRRTCLSHSLSLISNIFCQNWTNTFAHLSYTVSLGLPMGGLDKDACDAGWIWNEKCCSCREMVSAGTYCELATKCDVIIFKLHKYYTLCGVAICYEGKAFNHFTGCPTKLIIVIAEFIITKLSCSDRCSYIVTAEK